MQTTIIYLVCYFYALKAAKKLLDPKKSTQVLNVGLIVLVVMLSFTMIWQFVTVH